MFKKSRNTPDIKNKLIVGGSGIGKSMVIVRMDKKKYQKFDNFCKQNNYKYHAISSKQDFSVNCEKKVLELFNSLIH